MEIKAQVQNITKLKDYFFLVPDYQREYVWKVEDQVDQFLADIDSEFESGKDEQRSYFIGSIIIVKNGGKYDVIDGQQRLTTIVLTMCALRDILTSQILSDKQKQYLKSIEEWLSSFDIDSDKTQVRLELQYEESKDFLLTLIQNQPFQNTATTSIQKMQQAFDEIKKHLGGYLNSGAETLTEFARYFLTKIDIVVIESENLSSALKIFETINQRGAGLNAMDLVKNLLFSKVKEADFVKIKEKWKVINAHLQRCGEDESPLRFLRYFLMARYHDGILREDEIYKWIISSAGKEVLGYEKTPLEFAAELEKMASRYADLVKATGLMADGGDYPFVTNIGYINKYKSRQHLMLLLALGDKCPSTSINYLGRQLESFFFFCNTLGIQAKNYERQLAVWARSLRGLTDDQSIGSIVETTILPYLNERLAEFRQKFMNLRDSDYIPNYRLRFVLGRMENTLLAKCLLPPKGHAFIRELQVEHILPQTPKGGDIPKSYAENLEDYRNAVFQLGNVTLLESTINQAVNNFNYLPENWFGQKQQEYSNSAMLSTKLLNHNFAVGQNTAINRVKTEGGYAFDSWDRAAILARQRIMLDLALETWTINGRRIDAAEDAQVPSVASDSGS